MSCLPGLSLTIQFNTLASQIEKKPMPTGWQCLWMLQQLRQVEELVSDANSGSSIWFTRNGCPTFKKGLRMPPCLSTNISSPSPLVLWKMPQASVPPFQERGPFRTHQSLSRAPVWSQVKDLRAWAPSSLGTNFWEEAAPWYFLCLEIGISDSKNKNKGNRMGKGRMVRGNGEMEEGID